MACKFWWGSNFDRRKIHWVNWKKICKNKDQGGLGFRRTTIFNEALLAKQGWRIVTQPDSLVAKVLKAKYFPKSNFLEATLGNKQSYTWRSILQARWILKRGCYWNIGNGEHVHIWRDNWIPTQNGFKIWSKQKEDCQHKLVKDLIDPNTHNWNHFTIDHLFLPFEAREIYKIPLVDTTNRDELAWANSKDGVYSVKSGYHTILNWKDIDKSTAGSNFNQKDPTWTKLWKLNLPPKYTHLIWRILNKAIPVRDNLTSKGIQCSPMCPRCDCHIETIDHTFRDCEWAKAIWFGSALTIKFNNTNSTSPFADWITNMLQSVDKRTMELIITITYRIWHARNLLVFQEKKVPVDYVIQQAQFNATELHTLNKPVPDASKHAATRPCSHNTYWKAPAKGTLKANVDAHPCGDGRWSLGMLLRSEIGKFVGAATRVVSGFESTLDDEALGLKEVLDFTTAWPDIPIAIEMDSSTIVDSVKSKSYPRNYWGRIAHSCGDEIDRNPKRNICWVRRTGNQAAHTLANWASNEPNKTWLFNPPFVFRKLSKTMFPIVIVLSN
jgi:hypothetical protein